jgi:chromosomal replication initiation ATPase DnaA
MMSLPQLTVAKCFGRDHSTVIYARDKIMEQMETDSKLSVEINDIKKMLLKQ